MNETIQQFIDTFFPLPEMQQMVNSVLPYFGIVGVLLLLIGYIMMIARAEEILMPTARMMLLFLALVMTPVMFAVVQSIINGLVMDIASTVPGAGWIAVDNPGETTLTMNYTKPFATIASWLQGSFAPPTNTEWWQIDKWGDYLMRVATLTVVAWMAAGAEFVMEGLLVIQKVLLLGSQLFAPLFVGALALRGCQGAAEWFFRNVVGLMAWPLGWAVAHLGTLAAIQHMQGMNWTDTIADLIFAAIGLGLVFLWLILATILAPVAIHKTLATGSNFAVDLGSQYFGKLGRDIARGAESAGRVAGALAGSTLGPAGTSAGALMGGEAGKVLALPVSSISQAVGNFSDSAPLPSSRSSAAADAAIGGIKKRSEVKLAQQTWNEESC
jgi:hypothetical protein